MDDTQHDAHHDNAASTALHRAGSAGEGAWFGIAALATAAIALVGSIIRALSDSNLYSNDDFTFAERIAIFSVNFTSAVALLAIVALLHDGPSGRRFARFAVIMWLVALVLLAVADQRGLGKLPY